MNLSDFNYNLPENLIAQNPAVERDSSRLMIYDRSTKKIIHTHFKNITEYLSKQDVLVLNNSKVMPARFNFYHNSKLFEILVLKKISESVFECMVNPGKKFKPGSEFKINNNLFCKVENISETGRILKFHYNDGTPVSDSDLFCCGSMPLPPYISNFTGDINRYQTVYSKISGSAAAHTAGLHFTESLLDSIKSIVCDVLEITLHIGPGTFQPIKNEDFTKHKMHSEHFRIDIDTYSKLKKYKSENKRIIAVGTTSVRVLETVFNNKSETSELSGETDIFIYPGYKFNFIDAMITNFHLPKSSLLMLIAAFAGHNEIMDLYQTAIKHKYKFYSFGDAMLIK
ncbi:tRNA preQ1(34) S-adenosylmethionine ribosyltransferase-isomerase QueA [Candidatus Dependentiae bacterium]|nr:tRNA preQ1(34) S-adenosylmethionine ribosyltransferase-isomerase QueA [Candidatus Dependentiae bacterium]